MASANNPTICEEMKMTPHKKAPGGCGDIHQGRNAEHCYENTCIIPNFGHECKGRDDISWVLS